MPRGTPRGTLPHGDVGRIVNSFLSRRHPDAVEWQRQYRQRLRDTLPRNAALLDAVRAPVYLVKFSIGNRFPYHHAVRLPDHAQITNMVGVGPQFCFARRRIHALLNHYLPLITHGQ
jgi:hypothetical protein